MIKTETTLVLGAGASAPYGFPVGSQLYNKILENLAKGHEEYNMLIEANYDPWQIKQFTSALEKSGTSSIDQFLEHRKDFKDIGRAAICAILIPYENEEKLFNRNADNWYKVLFNSMNASFDEFKNNKIHFITFNYDRSLEVFLFNAIKNKYGVDDSEAAEASNAFAKLHVHGVLGGLPFQDKEVQEYFDLYKQDTVSNRTKFGKSNINQEFFREYNTFMAGSIINNTAKNIVTIHDTDNPKVYRIAFDILMQSRTIIFLGFGYHEENLTRLGISNLIDTHKTICGTSIGISETQKNHIETITNRRIRKSQLKDMTIADYLSKELILT